MADSDMTSVAAALSLTHAADGYPVVWPEDPVQWLRPPATEAAWLLEQDDRVLGHVCVRVGVGDPAVSRVTGIAAERSACVSRLFVVPEARGTGLATALLACARTHAVRIGVQLWLDVVDDDGPAVRLYERLGWRLVDRRGAGWVTPTGERWPVKVFLAPSRSAGAVMVGDAP